MARDTISQLDLVLVGKRRNFVARLLDVERQARTRAVAGGSPNEPVAEGLPELSQAAPLGDTIRPNLLLNSSFEHFNVGAAVPDQWVALTGCTLSLVASGGDGYYSVKLVNGQTIKQALAATLPQGSLVVSVAARTASSGQTVVLDVTASSGALTPAATFRVDQYGGVNPTDELPNDGRWYRFYKAYVYAGGGTPTFKINSGAGTGTIEVDAAKFEFEGGIISFLEPTAYISQDAGSAWLMRNFSAENIVAGTLTVGGPSSSNPRIYVKDSSGDVIVTIGDAAAGQRGITLEQGIATDNAVVWKDSASGSETGRVWSAGSAANAFAGVLAQSPGPAQAASGAVEALGDNYLTTNRNAKVAVNVDDSTPANNRVTLVVDNTTVVEAKAALARIFGTTLQVGSGTFGVFNATPVGQQSGGPATAGATYGLTEQIMLQKLYDAARAFGFIA